MGGLDLISSNTVRFLYALSASRTEQSLVNMEENMQERKLNAKLDDRAFYDLARAVYIEKNVRENRGESDARRPLL